MVDVTKDKNLAFIDHNDIIDVDSHDVKNVNNGSIDERYVSNTPLSCTRSNDTPEDVHEASPTKLAGNNNLDTTTTSY